MQGADSDNASVYLAGILAGETDGGYEIEALKAQAVVLRTELYRTEKEKQTILDKCLTQTQMKKKWGPKYEENLKKCQQAAQETKGIVLWYHETFAWAPFHQSSNGKTVRRAGGTWECRLSVHHSKKNVRLTRRQKMKFRYI